MKLLPCVKHPKAFWPWDRPYVSTMGPVGREGWFRSHVECPLCTKEAIVRHRNELRPKEAQSKHDAVLRWNDNG